LSKKSIEDALRSPQVVKQQQALQQEILKKQLEDEEKALNMLK